MLSDYWWKAVSQVKDELLDRVFDRIWFQGVVPALLSKKYGFMSPQPQYVLFSRRRDEATTDPRSFFLRRLSKSKHVYQSRSCLVLSIKLVFATLAMSHLYTFLLKWHLVFQPVDHLSIPSFHRDNVLDWLNIVGSRKAHIHWHHRQNWFEFVLH